MTRVRTRVRPFRAAAVTLILGVAAAACTDPPELSGTSSTTTATTARPWTSGTAELPSPPPAQPSPSQPSLPQPSSSLPSSPVPSASSFVLTEDDSGRTVTLSSGVTARLRLDGRRRWTPPAVEGDGAAVVLVPVDYETDPGFREWEVRAVRPGDAVIRTTGRPGPHHIDITVHVTD
ncbi:hypothetical protein J7E96_31665 [Streptomyces sp. ISL-96]|uniref:hypothetical protein n=1 Tax=Streptomyces sp. ISL-96 TaxID=2819191 RepID=UPI001BE55F0F|nr:hypothetical protein [Streptomyces sp. ISL-96]MBT2492984.1 hypothetical protein [Streptomyces sp. ISL-96]